MRWYDYVTVNLFWLGLNLSTGLVSPLLLPYLVALFVPAAEKNTYLSNLRVVGLAVAMLVQPLAGLLSDRSTSPWGRRRPYLLVGTVGSLLFLGLIGFSSHLADPGRPERFQPLPYLVLMAGGALWQATNNLSVGALQGLIPDLVPPEKRGRASGVKVLFELVLPAVLIVWIGPLLDRGLVWTVLGWVMVGMVASLLGTVLFVREVPQEKRPAAPLVGPLLRLLALTVLFLGVSRGVRWLVRAVGEWLAGPGVPLSRQVLGIGLGGLVGMAGAILVGVYLGVRIGLGPAVGGRRAFTWWVLNRLLFLAAAVSLQSFSFYFLADALGMENPASAATWVRVVVLVFLVPAALGGGHLADRWGRRRLVALAGLLAAGGAGLLLTAEAFSSVLIAGALAGLGVGTFFAASWALGTDLVPARQAGRYLGLANLAGAGAGIIGEGIGGPMADHLNALQAGLGYRVLFGLYGLLFLLSVLTLSGIKERAPAGG